MPPFSQTLHELHAHGALLVIVAVTLVAVGVGVWIAVAGYHDECARAGRRRSPRPPRRPR